MTTPLTTAQSDKILRGLRGRNKAFIRDMVGRGWTWKLCGSGHIQFRHPNGAVVHCSMTASEKSRKAFEADVKRAERQG